MNTKITLTNVRLSFPSLFETESFEDGQEGKYAATFLIRKDRKTLINQIIGIEDALIRDNELTKIGKGDARRALKDGDDKDYSGYEGCFAIKATNKFRPGLYDRKLQQVDQKESPFYAGCVVNAEIDLWAQNNKYGQRVNATLYNIQFVRDDEPLVPGKPPKPGFVPISDEELDQEKAALADL